MGQVELAAVQSSKPFPKKSLGMYILLADDTEDDFHTDNDQWEPLLHPYQQEGANVLFFTFINPETMAVPAAFKKLAASRGTNADGAVPADTLIIFAIGGYAYSLHPNPWEWLTSQSKAEAMAEQWPSGRMTTASMESTWTSRREPAVRGLLDPTWFTSSGNSSLSIRLDRQPADIRLPSDQGRD